MILDHVKSIWSCIHHPLALTHTALCSHNASTSHALYVISIRGLSMQSCSYNHDSCQLLVSVRPGITCTALT